MTSRLVDSPTKPGNLANGLPLRKLQWIEEVLIIDTRKIWPINALKTHRSVKLGKDRLKLNASALSGENAIVLQNSAKYG